MKKFCNFGSLCVAIAFNCFFILLFSATTSFMDKSDDLDVVKISLVSSNVGAMQNVSVEAEKRPSSTSLMPTEQSKNVREVVESNDDLYIPPKYSYGSVDNPVPKYPRLAVRKKHQGKVVVCVNVGAAGVVSEANICNSSGSRLLDSAALKTIKGWKFKAAQLGDQFVMAKVEIPVVFSLNKS